MPTKILAVDVCGTLYDENTTAGFVRFLSKRVSLGARFRVLELLRRSVARNGVIALGRLLRRDLFRENYILCLRGTTRQMLVSASRDYARHLEEVRRIEPVRTWLARATACGWSPMLVSNSLDVVVHAVGELLGIDAIASTLEFEGERCAGRLARDLTGSKLSALHAVTAERRSLAVITDNRSDSDLAGAADETWLVVKGAMKPWMRCWDAKVIHY